MCIFMQNYPILSYFSVEVNEVHVFLDNSIISVAITPVSNVGVQNCNNLVSWCTF